MYKIDYHSYRAIASFNRRVRFLIFHYTAQNFDESINSLTGPNVSAHYLIPDDIDQTYISAGFDDMRIFNLVDESERAWHAGTSYWAGRNNLNDSSIGIEIVNLAREDNGRFVFPIFSQKQINAVKQLSLNILQRYPDISPTQILGHSDIAIGRKNDPGAVFPWEALYQAGIGAWYDSDIKSNYLKQFKHQGIPDKQHILKKLQCYGYDINLATDEIGFNQLIRAFQLHFRSQNYSGIVDSETIAILYALVDKYFPDKA
ncbi:MAG: N-acetylmuramoyl-L-alanine amidase [Candidatus Schmidhempelia sp.]|nr:N-acetylmuramoyl-L-alanine amidase [Candidatus Schmidhempelia sp.]